MRGEVTETLTVAFAIRRPGREDRHDITRVVLTEGHSTRDDIPRMIAIRRGVSPDAVTVLAVKADTSG